MKNFSNILEISSEFGKISSSYDLALRNCMKEYATLRLSTIFNFLLTKHWLYLLSVYKHKILLRSGFESNKDKSMRNLIQNKKMWGYCNLIVFVRVLKCNMLYIGVKIRIMTSKWIFYLCQYDLSWRKNSVGTLCIFFIHTLYFL